MEDIGVGVIGAGRMGVHHATNFARHVFGATCAGIVDVEGDRAAEAARTLSIRQFGSVDELLSERSVAAVCIATPISTHKELIVRSLRAGKHVFCEKPLTLTLADADEIVREVDRSGLVFQLGFMRRFDAGFREAKRLVEAGAIGEPVYVSSLARDPGLPPVPGWGSNPSVCGDIAFELCSHDVDTMRWLMGSEIEELFAYAGTLSSKAIAENYAEFIKDTIVVSVKFANGALGTINGCLNVSYGYDARVEIVGNKGLIAVGSVGGDVLIASSDKKGCRTVAPSFIDRFLPAYLAEAQHFVDCIVKGERPLVSAEDGRMSVKATVAMNESIRSGRPVRLGVGA